MTPSHCALCGPGSPADLLYPERMPDGAVNARTFSARRLPDRVHSNIYRCGICGLIFADPVPGAEDLRALYRESSFTYDEVVPALRKSYGRTLRRVADILGNKGRLLEIGCGNGFMLEEALDQGYAEAFGVEAGRDAVDKSSSRVRNNIKVGIFDASMFPPASFDIVCAFQVFDHIPDPNAFLRNVAQVLRPGGAVFFLQHDAGAWSVKCLGERSPIFDIEHPYLYDRRSLPAILAKNGFQTARVFPVWNVCALRTLFHLAPLPGFLKRPLLAFLNGTLLGRIRLNVPLGNFGVVAVHPTGGGEPAAASGKRGDAS